MPKNKRYNSLLEDGQYLELEKQVAYDLASNMLSGLLINLKYYYGDAIGEEEIKGAVEHLKLLSKGIVDIEQLDLYMTSLIAVAKSSNPTIAKGWKA